MDGASASILDSENCKGLGRRGGQKNILGEGEIWLNVGPYSARISRHVMLYLPCTGVFHRSLSRNKKQIGSHSVDKETSKYTFFARKIRKNT